MPVVRQNLNSPEEQAGEECPRPVSDNHSPAVNHTAATCHCSRPHEAALLTTRAPQIVATRQRLTLASSIRFFCTCF